MPEFPLQPKDISLGNDMKSLTVSNRQFADFLKQQRGPSLTTPAGPIPWNQVKIEPNGRVTIFHQELTTMIDDALKQRQKPGFDPRAAINLGSCESINGICT